MASVMTSCVAAVILSTLLEIPDNPATLLAFLLGETPAR